MSRPAYYRDIWIFGPGNGYPGAFPNGFVTRMRRQWWGRRRLWICSGGFVDSGATMLDVSPKSKANVRAAAESLPFKDASFDFIFIDPPYSEEEAKRLYALPYIRLTTSLNEAWRVLEPGGYMGFLHRLIPQNDGNLRVRPSNIIALIGVSIIASWSNMRALTVWRKPNNLTSLDSIIVGKTSIDGA